MKIIKTNIIVAILLVAIVTPVLAQQIDNNIIDITGSAVVKVVPDIINLSILISEKQKNNTALLAKETQMIDRLNAIGVDVKKDLAIKDLASNFRVQVFSKDDIVISKKYLLTLHDGKTANKVILELEQLQISNVVVENLDHSRMVDYRKECRVNAIVEAKSKAKALTNAIGQDVGRAVYINEIEIFTTDHQRANQVKYRAERVAASTLSDLDFDEIVIESNVHVRFELK